MKRVLVYERSNLKEVFYSVNDGKVRQEPTLIASKVDPLIPYKRLNPVQTVFEKFYAGGSALVASPTSSGKSLIGYLFFRRNSVGRLVYLSPLRALASEKARELRRYYGNEVELRSGDDFFSSLLEPRKKVLVCTYDYFQIALRNRSPWTEEVSAVVFDEVHTILKKPIYEELVVLSKRYPLLALSATVPDLEKVAGWLEVDLLIESHWRPVPLERNVYSFVSKGEPKAKVSSTEERNAIRLFNWLYELKRPGEQVLLFVPRKSLGWKLLEVASKERLGVMNEFVPFDKPEEEREPEIAFHNADVPKEEREQIERAFREGRLPVLVATQTLAYGVNLPADRVIVFVKGFWKDGKSYTVPDPLDIKQMEGRAGRLGIKDRGYVDLLLYGISKEEFEKQYRLMKVKPEVREVSTLMVLLAVHYEGRNYRNFLSKTYNFAFLENVDRKVKLLHERGFLKDYRLTHWGEFCLSSNLLPERVYTFLKRLRQGLSYEYTVRPLIRKEFRSLESFLQKYPQLEDDRQVVRYRSGQEEPFTQEAFGESEQMLDNTEDFVLYVWGTFARYPGFKLPAEFDLSSESLYLLKHLMKLKEYIPWTEREIFLQVHSVRHGLRAKWALLGSLKGIGYVRGNMLLQALEEIGATPPDFDQQVGNYFSQIDPRELKELLKESLEQRELRKEHINAEIRRIDNVLKSHREAYFFDEAIARAYLYLKSRNYEYLTASKKKLLEALKEAFYIYTF